MKRWVAILTAISLSCSLFSGCSDTPNTETTAVSETSISPAVVLAEDYNKLQTITLFGETAPSGSDIPALEPPNGTSLLPSVMLEASTMSVLLRDWAVTDLSLYVPNSYIQLEVKCISAIISSDLIVRRILLRTHLILFSV